MPDTTTTDATATQPHVLLAGKRTQLANVPALVYLLALALVHWHILPDALAQQVAPVLADQFVILFAALSPPLVAWFRARVGQPALPPKAPR